MKPLKRARSRRSSGIPFWMTALVWMTARAVNAARTYVEESYSGTGLAAGAALASV